MRPPLRTHGCARCTNSTRRSSRSFIQSRGAGSEVIFAITAMSARVVDQLVDHGGRVVDLEREGEALVLAFQGREDRHHVIGAVGPKPAGARASARASHREQSPAPPSSAANSRDCVALQRLPGRRKLHTAPPCGRTGRRRSSPPAPSLAPKGSAGSRRRSAPRAKSYRAGNNMEGAKLRQVHIGIIYRSYPNSILDRYGDAG